MKTIKKLVLAGLACLTVSAVQAGTVKFNGYLANEAGVSTAKTYQFPLNSYAIDQVSYQINWATASPTSVSFTDGSESTGTITIASNAALSTATATAFMTVLSTNVAGACITLFNGSGSQTICNAGWRVDVTSDTAADIVTQMNNVFTSITSTSALTSSVISSTTTATGSITNNYSFTTNTSSITVNGKTALTGTFTGGQDGATLYIGNAVYKFGGNVNVGASSGTTATNLATAINNSSNTYNVVANAVSGVVSTTSTIVGTIANYVVYSSTQSALTIGGSTVVIAGLNGAGQGQMWGGTNAAYTLVNGSATIISATNPFSPLTTSLGAPASVIPTPMVGLPVLYSTGSSQAIVGLVNQATYYAIPVSIGSFGLATTSTGAVAGKFITLTSSQAKTTADTFTLAPLAYSGTASGLWQVSNDNINWIQYPTISTNTFTAVNPSSSTVVDLGNVNYANIRYNFTPSTAGGLILQVIPNGKNSAY